ncbi:MAG TPA: cytochrome c maturation protein CcmE [bacterium]|nr:cytochrome c maturation protein CcmE [bacterium]
MKTKYVIGFAVIAACLAVGIYSLKSSMTPYVPFKDAKAAEGREVQVIGSIVKGSTKLDASKTAHSFTLEDKDGATLDVITTENLPTNFEHASSVVAIGSWKKDRFVARRLLVKCPSKYEKKAEESEEGKKQP